MITFKKRDSRDSPKLLDVITKGYRFSKTTQT